MSQLQYTRIAMAYLKSKTLFFTTSPRSPLKMIPEIEVLHNNFEGKVWNTDTQVAFIKKLAEGSDFEGQGSEKNMALSARDRITRAPKALGFVDLRPVIKLTEPGEKLINGKRTEEVLLRQLLKFQLPSPYHKEPEDFNGLFGVKPYLEIFRLIYELGTVSFDELMIFGMQLTHYNKFEQVVSEIKQFRRMKTYAEASYKIFRGTYLRNEVEKIYQENIHEGNTKTRESRDKSLDKFVKTKASNMRDYADACFRYLRATGMVEISQRGHSLSIMPEKKAEVEYFLNTVDRKPVYIDDEEKYKEYLFDTTIPALYSDDRDRLLKQVVGVTGTTKDLSAKTTEELKDILEDAIVTKKTKIVSMWGGKEGFDFLGMHHRRFTKTRKDGRKYGDTYQYPTRKAMKKMKQTIKKNVNQRYLLTRTEEELIKNLNPKIIGWRNYYRTERNGKWMQALDWYILCTFCRWYNKKHHQRQRLKGLRNTRQRLEQKGLQRMTA